MTIGHHDGVMRKIILPGIELVNTCIISDPNHVIAVFKNACNEVTSDRAWIIFIMLKVDSANAIIARDAIAGAHPDITAAILQKMVNDILSQAILDIQMFEVVIGVEFLGCEGSKNE
jgi:hypothetical protein